MQSISGVDRPHQNIGSHSGPNRFTLWGMNCRAPAVREMKGIDSVRAEIETLRTELAAAEGGRRRPRPRFRMRKPRSSPCRRVGAHPGARIVGLELESHPGPVPGRIGPALTSPCVPDSATNPTEPTSRAAESTGGYALTERRRVFMRGACHGVGVGASGNSTAERRDCRRAIRFIAASPGTQGRNCNTHCAILSLTEFTDVGAANDSAYRAGPRTCAKGRKG